jgi:5-formyltetrahydrofolate cyclo-ligase
MDIIEEKKQLRKLMFKARKSLDLSFKTEYDKWICNELLSLVKSNNYNSIHVYLPMGDEINIYPFIQKVLELNKIVIAPKTLPNRQLENLVLDNLEKVKKGVFGTTYPGSENVYNESIDLIVVPGLAVDLENYRLGYGGGYYDTFMSRYPNANKVGIFYPFQLADKVPTEPHDLKLNQVLIGDN